MTNKKLRITILIALSVIVIFAVMPQVEATHDRYPYPVTNLQVTDVTNTTISLTWDAPTHHASDSNPFSHYRIAFPIVLAHWPVNFVDTPLEHVTLVNLIPNTTYHINVSTFNDYGFGSSKQRVDVTTLSTIPNTPTNLNANQKESDGEITLSWTAPTGNVNQVVTDYKVQYKNDRSSVWTLYNDGVSTSTSAILPSGLFSLYENYEFRVLATNSGGDGNYSNIAETMFCGDTIVTQDQPHKIDRWGFC